jgi:hypothetical protein
VKPVAIKTTAHLRQFLTDLMVGVQSGEIEPNRAVAVVKIAQAVNESFNVEIKARLLEVQGRGAALRPLPIGEASGPPAIEGSAVVAGSPPRRTDDENVLRALALVEGGRFTVNRAADQCGVDVADLREAMEARDA